MNANELLWPCDLPISTKRILLSSARVLTLDIDQEMLLNRGLANSLFCVKRGLVVVGMHNFAKSCPVVVFKPGDWFGGAAAGKTPQLPFKASGIQYSEIVFIPHAVVQRAALSDPAVYQLLYLVIAIQCAATIDILFASSGMKLTQRVAYFLLQISKKFPRIKGVKPMISLSQTILAQILGLSRLTLNQQLRMLERKNTIAVERKRVHILDIPLLEAMIGIEKM